MKDNIFVYISSPYTIGNKDLNVLRQIDMHSELMDLGFIPFTPLLVHYVDAYHGRSYESWMDYDLKWIEKCTCVLRLPGESKGADIEVARAKELGIPVFYSVEELIKNYEARDKE